MEKLNLTVEYIHHSCFTVEIGDKILVFDYFKGDINLKDKEIYVFASHDHGDHFSPKILEWKKDFKNINYILSDDIKVEEDENITFMAPYKEKTINNIKIKTFGSTDKGVSFLVSVDGVNIFHAGDLNWWYWDDDTELEKINMENSFKIKVKRLKESGIDIDLAFFPVDPRLEEYFHLGGQYFIEEIKPKYFFPMHAWDKYEISKKFIHKMNEKDSFIVDIQHDNQVIKL
ncbi:MAG: MBL fold metallo-hydrolase [Tissierellaceae bacterium]|nr:MBL fold metallo-hydrolase [Tissierellaceae bacterium]